MSEQVPSNKQVYLQFASYARQITSPSEYEEDPPVWRVLGQSGDTYRGATLVEALRDFWDSEIRHRDIDGKPIEADPCSTNEPPAAPYRVEPTRCNCHPETCCCPDYTIWKGDIPIARGSDERLLREFVLTENARASQPPAPAPRFQVGQEVFAGCAVRKVLAISHCYKLSNTICEGSGWTMFDEHSVEPCSGTTKGA